LKFDERVNTTLGHSNSSTHKSQEKVGKCHPIGPTDGSTDRNTDQGFDFFPAPKWLLHAVFLVAYEHDIQ